MVTVRRTSEFSKWLKRLKDTEARARIIVRIQRVLLTGNYGDVKPIDGDIYEMRIDYGAGYRLYYAHRGSDVILLLAGGNKSSQKRDIAKAKKLNLKYE